MVVFGGVCVCSLYLFVCLLFLPRALLPGSITSDYENSSAPCVTKSLRNPPAYSASLIKSETRQQQNFSAFLLRAVFRIIFNFKIDHPGPGPGPPKPARRRARRVAGSEGVECEGAEFGVLPLICFSMFPSRQSS